ncbi:carbohydrate ABC transporter permease [Dactylococcopsis salina]|uniref:ABC-type sugar transport system, permease component n=1 Tax=Dactylococcopsis salina (strain PCC 8305) TaxID=13035 RepID=K9YVL8_DACS8|nr:carbohydrate ABC transporter permease [Dactylococcopsis salina]AFZ50380.1 ABC-type sugar transport system, permease component [Dactylococcopsis salina PCC 8305]
MEITQEKVSTATASKSKIPKKRIALFFGIIFVLVFCLAPAMWQVLTSFKINEAIATVPNVYLPSLDQLTWEHYNNLFSRRPFLLYIFNSLFVAATATLIALATGAPAAYALARLRIPGEKFLVAIVLVVTLFPYVLLFLGLFEVVKALDLGNNYLALIIPYAGKNLPLTILVLRTFFQQLPKDLEDSAKIDGYNTVQMLLRIVLPMTIPALVTTGILAFIFAWNEFIFALTFVTEESMKTIPVATAQIGGSSIFEIPYGPIAAATVAGTIPLILMVLFFQRRIVQGLTAGAVKG